MAELMVLVINIKTERLIKRQMGKKSSWESKMHIAWNQRTFPWMTNLFIWTNVVMNIQ